MRKLLITVFTVLPLIAISTASAGAPVNRLVETNTQEPVVVVDRHGGTTVVIGTNGYRSVGASYPTAYFTSRGRRLNFKAHTAPLPLPYNYAADPSMGVAGSGTIFYAYIGETPSYCGGKPGSSAILVTASTNRGASFRPPTAANISISDDKPFMAVETVPGHQSHVFVAWTRYANGSGIWLTRSLDGGVTFSPAQLIYSSPGTNSGAVPVVGPNGRIYVFWSSLTGLNANLPGKGRIFVSTSTNDGGTFSTARPVVSSFASMPYMPEPGALRVPTFPSAAVTPRGRLYVTWSAVSRDLGHGQVTSDIMLSNSKDGGQTWSRPRIVNDSRAGDRFMPAISAYSDGSAGIAFYDRRNDPNHLDVYAAHASFVHGVHISRNVKVNDTYTRVTDFYQAKPGTSQCYSPGRFFGDYIGTAALPNHRLYVTWTGAQLHTYARSEIWLAKVVLPAT